MEKDIIYFAENICGIKLNDSQKDLLLAAKDAHDKGEMLCINLARRQGWQLANNILVNFEFWLKKQQIAELENELNLYKEAYRLACIWIDGCSWQDNDCDTPSNCDYFMMRAKQNLEEIKNDQRD